MASPKFYLKDGITLTRYGLWCGYVQRQEMPGEFGRYKEMYVEHAHIHIKTGMKNQRYDSWETFDAGEFTKARKYFRSIDIRPWETEMRALYTDAKRYQRMKQKEGCKTKLVPHLGIAHPYYEVKWMPKPNTQKN